MDKNKERRYQIIIGILVAIIVIGISFFGSENKNKCIEQEVKEELLVEISLEEYSELVKSGETDFVYIGRDDCTFAASQMPIIEEIASENNFIVNYLNLSNIDSEKIDLLIDSHKSFETTISTPTFVFIKDKKVTTVEVGYREKSDVLELLKTNGIIE